MHRVDLKLNWSMNLKRWSKKDVTSSHKRQGYISHRSYAKHKIYSYVNITFKNNQLKFFGGIL